MDGDVLRTDTAARAAPAADAVRIAYRPAPFRAARLLRSGHAQTIAGKLLRPQPRMPLRRERWDTPDGDFLDLDFVEEQEGAQEQDREQRPVVLVLHGLEGSSQRSYVLMTYRALRKRGMAAVGLNFRGCSGEPNLLPRFYHSGETGDVAWVLERLRERFPGRPFAAIGYSLGGNVLLKLLGERGDDARSLVDAAVAISVPYDLAAGSLGLERGFINRHLYTRYFIRVLRRKTGLKREMLRDRLDVDAAIRAVTLRAFDDAATAPLHGFESALDYYARCSSGSFLAGIRVPTLLIQAADDPFQPAGALPREAVAANPWLTGCFTTHGGHVGFIEGSPWRPRFWVEREAARYVEAACG